MAVTAPFGMDDEAHTVSIDNIPFPLLLPSSSPSSSLPAPLLQPFSGSTDWIKWLV